MAKTEISRIADRLALDRTITDYDFWRAQKTVEDELYRKNRQHRPIPIALVYARAIIRSAQIRRGR